MDVKPQGEEITFNNARTRATYTKLSDITEFGIYAQMSDEPDPNYQQSNDVEYTHILVGTDGKGVKVYDIADDDPDMGYVYDDIAYWVDQRTFHFFGYWPYSTVARKAPNGLSYELVFEVEKLSDYETKTDDLLTFHYTTVYTQGNATTVDVNFKHALSKVTFSMSQDFTKNPFDRFNVTSVTLTPIMSGGTYTTPRYNDGDDGEWHYSDNRLNFSRTFPAINPEDPNPQFKSDVNNLSIFKDLKLVPQKIESGTIGLVVKYTYEQGTPNGGSVEYTDPVEKTASTFLPVGEWKPGKMYHYKMSLYQDNLIVFKNIDISPWGEQPDAGTIIIK